MKFTFDLKVCIAGSDDLFCNGSLFGDMRGNTCPRVGEYIYLPIPDEIIETDSRAVPSKVVCVEHNMSEPGVLTPHLVVHFKWDESSDYTAEAMKKCWSEELDRADRINYFIVYSDHTFSVSDEPLLDMIDVLLELENEE